MHGEKHWTAQRQLETLFILVAASQFLVSQSDFLMNKTLLCKEVGELSPCSKLSKGPCMDLSLHVPNVYRKVVFNWLLTNRSISYGSEYILFMYWSRGLLLWMVQRKCRFRNWKRGDGTTQKFVSGTFRSGNSNSAYWPNRLGKYLRVLTHKLRPESWGETEKPLLCRVLVSSLERG